MPLFVGDKPIRQAFVGDKPVRRIYLGDTEVWSAKVDIVGANANDGNTVTIPAHKVGDLIVIFAGRDNSDTRPSVPSASGTVPAWQPVLDNNGSGNAISSCTFCFTATATNHTSGTWSNATGMIAVVLRGQDTVTPIGAAAESGASNASQGIAPAVTLTEADGSSAVLHFIVHKNVNTLNAAPAGYTREAASAGLEVFCNSRDDTTSAPAMTQTMSAAFGGYRGATVEVLRPVYGLRFDSVGAPTHPAAGGGPATSYSFPHTKIAGDALVAYLYVMGQSGGATTAAMTCGGESMDLLAGPVNVHNDGTWWTKLFAFGLLDPPKGDQTIAATWDVSSYFSVGSVSYRNVSEFGTPVVDSGATSSANLVVPSTASRWVSGAIACAPNGGAGTVTSYSQTARWNPGRLMVIGDAAGESPNAVFTATATTRWAGIGVPLIP